MTSLPVVGATSLDDQARILRLSAPDWIREFGPFDESLPLKALIAVAAIAR
jgi:hypothetical protein